MPAQNWSKLATIDFTNLDPASLAGNTYLDPGWYKVRIGDSKYYPESVTADGKQLSARIAWQLTVLDVLSPDVKEASKAVGKAISHTFWYGQKNNFGERRFMQALEALRGKTPAHKLLKAFDLADNDGQIVLIKVDDNKFNGNTRSEVQTYRNAAEEAQIRQDESAAVAARPLSAVGQVGVPDVLPFARNGATPAPKAAGLAAMAAIASAPAAASGGAGTAVLDAEESTDDPYDE